jgi:N-acetylmuramoyl-L-alanine amidase
MKSIQPVIIIDPGHGMSNRRAGVYDSGAVSVNGAQEASIAMDWANELRSILKERKIAVIRTRADRDDPAPVGQRAAIAQRYNGTIMLSLHCNSGGGSGTETFYRGASNLAKARAINDACRLALGTRNRGAKTEDQSQHGRLAIMAFQPTFLLEIGFIDHAGDLSKMLNADLRKEACNKIADVLLNYA